MISPVCAFSVKQGDNIDLAFTLALQLNLDFSITFTESGPTATVFPIVNDIAIQKIAFTPASVKTFDAEGF